MPYRRRYREKVLGKAAIGTEFSWNFR
jgi:hypothetical protein